MRNLAMRVVGTAGHVDHGKSTLVRALTGIDPDRLKEEKLRGMTIDLGFAWMELPDVAGVTTSVGIVDVPGHIDFIKNMLAGVGGIDAAILVIAADEGVMPQTREHLAILDLLAVPTLVVALTKVDAAPDDDWLDLVELDIHDVLAQTRFAAAPIVRVRALQGIGLDELRATLAQQLAALPVRRNVGRPRLPIDRIFSLSGFGTVVTGTLSDGNLVAGDAVEVLPARLPARIRGMQAHRHSIDSAEPGMRVALNLAGVGTEALQRGDVVVRPGTIQPTTLIDVQFRLLADAPRPLRHNIQVDFFSGAAETPAHVRLLGVEQLAPGESGWLQLKLARPVVVAGGDRFILRRPSPSLTLGGGVVVNAHPPRRWRRFDPDVPRQLAVMAQGAPEDVLLQSLERMPLAGAARLASSAGLDEVAARHLLDSLCQAGAVIQPTSGPDGAYISTARWRELLTVLTRLTGEYHAGNPLRRGMPRGELRSRLTALLPAIDLSVRLFNGVVEAAVIDQALAADDTFVWLPSFRVSLSAAQAQHLASAQTVLARAGFSPPSAEELLRILQGDGALVEMLVEQGTWVRVNPTLIYRAEEFDQISQKIQAHLAQAGSITLAEARDLLDTSRKYAQAVLEELDARKITRRVGDSRVLR